jgi:hypothetical protein
LLGNLVRTYILFIAQNIAKLTFVAGEANAVSAYAGCVLSGANHILATPVFTREK